ncbi:MAG: histidine phosphatase family protein [Chloroflexi bacterium]|nr:histidine phosphatase family protein [Chloroflexota bacterium]
MTRVILCRHGETDWHVARRLSIPEAALNERGRVQAHALAERLREEGVSAIYSSPLKRAHETAEIMAKNMGLMPQVIEALKDWDYGVWKGLPDQEMKEKEPELFRLWHESPNLVSFSKGEGLADVRRRSLAAMEKILNLNQGNTVAIVAHDSICRVIICSILGLDDSHHWLLSQDIASVSIFVREGSRVFVEVLNDTCHLRNSND